MTSGRRRELAGIDLNLLVSLDALLRERSVTRAATRLGLSQPTLSTALGRLRRHFGDELLTRVGNTYELTPLAADLAERTTGALGVLERVFAGRPDFDPAASEREFTVVMSDYAATVVGGHLSRLLAERAPRTCLRIGQIDGTIVDSAPESLRGVDGLLIPHGYLSDLPHLDVYADRWVCVVSADNPAAADLTREHLETAPMVATYRSPTAFTLADKQLAMTGTRGRVVAVAQSFLAVPFLVAGTDRFALLQERLADRLTAFADVVAVPCPFPTTPLLEALWWHPTHERDAGHQWFRGIVAEVAAQLTEERADDPRAPAAP